MKRRDEILVGLFTTAAVIILVVGTIWLLRGGLAKGYPLYATFPWGSGIKEGQPVWLSGVTVGFVDDVELLEDGRLTTTFRILDKYKVPLGSEASIVPNGFFGDVAIALRPKAPNPNSFEEGDTVPSAPGAAGLQVLASRADSLTMTLQTIFGSTRTQLVDSGGLREMRLMMQSLNRTATQLSRAVDVQSRHLEATLATVRSRVAAVDSNQVDSTVRAIQRATANFNEASEQFKTTSVKLNTLLTKADSGPGTLAKLLNDDKLYNNVVSLSARFDTLMFDFKKNPRRYVNLSIFGR